MSAKLYLVFVDDCEGDYLRGIFSTKVIAQYYCDTHEAYVGKFRIDEVILDEEIE